MKRPKVKKLKVWNIGFKIFFLIADGGELVVVAVDKRQKSNHDWVGLTVGLAAPSSVTIQIHDTPLNGAYMQ